MSLRIRMDFDPSSVLGLFNGPLSQTQLTRAAKRAANRTLLTIRKTAIGMIRTKLNVRPSDLKKANYISLDRATGNRLENVRASVVFSKRPIDMLYFVKGSKEPAPQKGIKVKRRRKVKVEIVPGKRTVLRRGFIANVRTKQIFKHKRTHSKDLVKQGVAGVGILIDERGMGEKIALIERVRFRDLFIKEVHARVNGFVKR